MLDLLNLFINQTKLNKIISDLENEHSTLKSRVHDEVEKALKSRLHANQYSNFITSRSTEIQFIEDRLFKKYSSTIQQRISNLLFLRKEPGLQT